MFGLIEKKNFIELLSFQICISRSFFFPINPNIKEYHEREYQVLLYLIVKITSVTDLVNNEYSKQIF
jgi:hypothetical protein